MSDKLLDTRSNFRLFVKRLGRLISWNGVAAFQYQYNFKNSYLPRRMRFNLVSVAAILVWYYSHTRLRNQAGFVDEKESPEKRVYNFAPNAFYNWHAKQKTLDQMRPDGKQYIF